MDNKERAIPTGISFKRLLPFLTPSLKVKLALGEAKVEDYFLFSKKGSKDFVDFVRKDVEHLLPKDKKKWEGQSLPSKVEGRYS